MMTEFPSFGNYCLKKEKINKKKIKKLDIQSDVHV